MIPIEFEQIGKGYDGWGIVKNNGYWGVVDDGKIILPFHYDSIIEKRNNGEIYYETTLGDKTDFFDKNGKFADFQ